MARSERSALPHGPTTGVTSPPLPASGTSFIKKLQKPAGVCVRVLHERGESGRSEEAPSRSGDICPGSPVASGSVTQTEGYRQNPLSVADTPHLRGKEFPSAESPPRHLTTVRKNTTHRLLLAGKMGAAASLKMVTSGRGRPQLSPKRWPFQSPTFY